MKDALHAAGLSNRQVKALLAGGWGRVVSESEAEAAELREQLEALRGTFSGERVS